MINRLRLYRLRPAGVIVPTMVFIMIILTVSALALADFAIRHQDRLNTNYFATNSLLAAEAGAEQSLYQLNQNSSFSGFASEQEFFNETAQGRGTYQTEVVNGNLANEKLITSVGRIYRQPTDTSPIITRRVKLTVVGTTNPGYSVHTGPGGLIMSNSATIANGEVYVNGHLNMSNSSRIGSTQNPIKVNVAHQNCPAGGGPSYPSQCTSGQPITITNSARIYGQVCATNQTNNSGMSHPGLQNGCVAPATALPTHDRSAQINSVTNTITGTNASCNGSQSRIFAAGTRVNGDLIISNSCQVTVNGPLWVTGKFEIKNSASIRVGTSVTSQPVIMVDGNKVDFSNSSSIIANANNIGFLFINYYSRAACSPDCGEVTGVDLYNSREVETIKLNNSNLAAGSVMYARWTKVSLQNSGSVGSLIGQTVQLNNSGNISFGTQLSSGQSVWSIKNYQQIFD